MTDFHLLTNHYRTFTLRTKSTGLTLRATIILLCSPQDRNQTTKDSTMYQALFKLVNPKSVYSFLLLHFSGNHNKDCCPTFSGPVLVSWLTFWCFSMQTPRMWVPIFLESMSLATLFSMVVIMWYTGLAIPKYIKPVFQSKVLQQQTARSRKQILGLE